MTAALYVGNLAWSSTDDDLFQLFANQSDVISATVSCPEDSGRSKGWGLVEFSNATSAQNSIQELNGASLHNRQITLREVFFMVILIQYTFTPC